MVLPESGHKALRRHYTRYLTDNVRCFLSFYKQGVPLRDLVEFALARDPTALLACFASPGIGTAIRCYQRRGSWPGFSKAIEEAFEQCPAAVLFELAWRRLLPEGKIFDFDLGAPSLAACDLRILISSSTKARGWRFRNGLLTLLGSGGEGPSLRLEASSLGRGRKPVQGMRSEMAYVPLSGAFPLALWDNNPIAALEAHPEKSGSVLDLGHHSEEDWRSSLENALTWIRAAWPELSREMDILLKQVVPVGFHEQKHLSASYREAIGTVYLSLHPDPLVMASALIHEFQHNKLNLLSYEDEVLHNAFEPLYPSPVRPDPRPLWGVVMAVHAFLPVAVFLRKLRQNGHPAAKGPAFEKRLHEMDLKNAEGMATLRRHGDFTDMGREVFKELEVIELEHRQEWKSKGVLLDCHLAYDA